MFGLANSRNLGAAFGPGGLRSLSGLARGGLGAVGAMRPPAMQTPYDLGAVGMQQPGMPGMPPGMYYQGGQGGHGAFQLGPPSGLPPPGFGEKGPGAPPPAASGAPSPFGDGQRLYPGANGGWTTYDGAPAPPPATGGPFGGQRLDPSMGAPGAPTPYGGPLDGTPYLGAFGMQPPGVPGMPFGGQPGGPIGGHYNQIGAPDDPNNAAYLWNRPDLWTQPWQGPRPDGGQGPMSPQERMNMPQPGTPGAMTNLADLLRQRFTVGGFAGRGGNGTIAY